MSSISDGNVILTLDYCVPCWFAVYTKARHEKKVKALLDEKRIENYLPLIKEYHRWTDRKQQVEVPLIRGYIFVRIAAKYAVYVLEVPGAVRFVKFQNEVAPIPDFQIEALKRVIESGVDFRARKYLKTGQMVEVEDGPLKGIIGKIQRIENESRFVITLDAPQAAYEVQVDPKYLKPYDKKDSRIVRVSLPLGM